MKKKFPDKDGIRTCNRCMKEYPLTLDYFHRNNKLKINFQCICKFCDNEQRTIRWKNKLSHNHKRHCKHCGKFFWAALLQINKARRAGRKDVYFCSKECQSHYFTRKGSIWNGKRKGSHNPNAILNDEKIIYIKNQISLGRKITDLAKEIGVHRSTVYSIKTGKSWKHIELPVQSFSLTFNQGRSKNAISQRKESQHQERF